MPKHVHSSRCFSRMDEVMDKGDTYSCTLRTARKKRSSQPKGYVVFMTLLYHRLSATQSVNYQELLKQGRWKNLTQDQQSVFNAFASRLPADGVDVNNFFNQPNFPSTLKSVMIDILDGRSGGSVTSTNIKKLVPTPTFGTHITFDDDDDNIVPRQTRRVKGVPIGQWWNTNPNIWGTPQSELTEEQQTLYDNRYKVLQSAAKKGKTRKK